MFSIFLKIVSIVLVVLYLIGIDPFALINIDIEVGLRWGIPIFLFALSFIKPKKKRQKRKDKKEEMKLPFEKKYYFPYKERAYSDDIGKYLEGEKLYLEGKKEEAKAIWETLAKKGNIDSMHGLICYYIETGDGLSAIKYSDVSAHGYASFNRALVEYRGIQCKNKNVAKEGFSFDVVNRNFTYVFNKSSCMKYFRDAALQDVVEAQYNLGFIYQNGETGAMINYHDGKLYVAKNLFLAIYWYYRGAIHGHGGCIRGLCEVYKELLPRLEEAVALKFKKAIVPLEKWIENNPDKIGERKLILKHFPVTRHEKYEKYDEKESIRELVKQTISLMKKKVTYFSSEISEVDGKNYFKFDRYVLTLNYKEFGDNIPFIAPEIVFKGEGDITYGTIMTTSKQDGIDSITYKLYDDFNNNLHEVIKKNPYCSLVFEKEFNTYTESYGSKHTIGEHAFFNFPNLFAKISIDDSNISSKLYVYVPPKKYEPYIFPPSTYDPPIGNSTFLSFGDNSEGLYLTTGSNDTPLYRDVANSNIFHDSAGNKYFSPDDGKSVIKW